MRCLLCIFFGVFFADLVVFLHFTCLHCVVLIVLTLSLTSITKKYKYTLARTMLPIALVGSGHVTNGINCYGLFKDTASCLFSVVVESHCVGGSSVFVMPQCGEHRVLLRYC
jgi:hypothetical protein